MQTAVGTGEELGISPSLCRMERRATRADIVALNRVLVGQFIAAQAADPQELVLDIDASDIPLHGDQERTEFHAYYDHYCYLPLYVFCGKSMLACVLRKSQIDGAKHAAALIKLLVTRLRQAWPAVRLIVRGDSGFCRQHLIGGELDSVINGLLKVSGREPPGRVPRAPFGCVRIGPCAG